MSRRIPRTPRLADRDYEILEHLMRYHMTTREVLHRLFFSDSEPNAATKVTSRLVLHGWLNRHDFRPPRTYYTLGAQSARLLGISEDKTKLLGPRYLMREYGSLAFCCLATRSRERLLVREVQQNYPQLLHGGLDSSHYYLDQDGQTERLGYIRVDLGVPTEAIIHDCQADLQARFRHQAFQRFIEEDRFLIAVVTLSQHKAAAIGEQLRSCEWPCLFRIEVVSDLAELLPQYPLGSDVALDR